MLATLPVDRVICGRYRIRSVLGKGGMGVVFKADDIALGRTVAIKLSALRNPLDDEPDPNLEERFLREASLNAQITHPNVVTIYDYGHGEEGGEPFCFIAMELLSGETLGERLRRNRTGLPISESLSIATQVTRGLRAAHLRGLVHRDLKPHNIMLTPAEDGGECARILDFGLAKDTRTTHDRRLTDAGTVMGTPEYMAPEQVEAREVDGRTDLYALGIVLYECLAGQPPFHGENAFRVASSQVREPPPPLVLPAGRLDASPALRDLVRQLLEKAPDARVQSAADLLRCFGDLPEARAARARPAVDTLSLATNNRYQTGRKLSDGPRATVYDATHLELGRLVAIKVYRAAQARELARLKRDLPGIALLRHASNTRVLDWGQTTAGPEGLPFLVMERVRGPTLRALLTKHGRLPWRRAVDVVVAVLEGIGEAHTVGILHRHLTPDHVLVPGADTRREGVKIIGYRVAEGAPEGSEPRHLGLPDPAYTAPEVMRGAPVGEPNDLYSAAAILHECVLGAPPDAFRGAARHDVQQSFPPDAGPPEPCDDDLLAKPEEPIPPQLADIMRRAISVDPNERFDSAATFVTALLAAAAPDKHHGSLTEEMEGRVSFSQQRLRSTGQPVVWFLVGDPALRKPPVTEVMQRLRSTVRVEEISSDQGAMLAARLRGEEELPPWVVVFGGMHVILEDPLLALLARAPEVSRVLISTHANLELLEGAINFCGLDHQITLPAAPAEVLSAVDRMVARSGAARRYYDDLRMFAQRSSAPPAVTGRSARHAASM